MVSTNQRPPIFYGWLLLAAAFLIIAVGMGMVFSFSVFLIPLQVEFGWSRGEVALTNLLNWLAFGVSSLLLGTLSDRIGIKKVVFAGGVILGIGMALASRVSSLWQLYLSFGLLGGIGMGAFYVPLNTMAATWFKKYRGLAIAIVSSGIGVGILLIAPLTRYWILVYDWQTALLCLAGLAWGIVLPLSLLIRSSPAERGEQPYGAFTAGVPPSHSAEPAHASRSENGGETFRSRPFWLIAFTHFFCCIAHSGPIFHMVAYASDGGLPPVTAASLFGISGLASIIGRLGTGVIADYFGAKRTLVAGLTLQAFAISLYLFAESFWSLFLLALLFGPAYGGVMPLYALLTRQYFGEKVMGTMYGGIFALSALGMGIGSYMGGYIFDLTGAYTLLYVKSTILGSLAVLLAMSLRSPRQQLASWRLETGQTN